MDLGTVTSKLVEGTYQSVGAFVADCRLVCENCNAYYKGRHDGAVFTEQAERLQAAMAQQLGALVRYDQSTEGNKSRSASMLYPPAVISKPSGDFLNGILRDLRASSYTDRGTKLTERATAQFEKPVDLNLFPDYRQIVEEPMDLEIVEKKIEEGKYETPEDFEYDMHLIFKNCEKYNVPKNHDHIVALAKHCAKTFRKLYQNKMKNFESRSSSKEIDKKRPRPPSPHLDTSSKTSKKVKADPAPKNNKPAPKISISSNKTGDSTPSGKTSPKPKPKSPVKISVNNGGGKKKSAIDSVAGDGPVTLNVAMARVKERFSGLRSSKHLDPWEQACYRFFRELMRHPWLIPNRSKFTFHAPVSMLFPEVAQAYESKIKHPMDLTTAEAKLLQGGLYEKPQEFVDDIALVFSNAISFNQAGHETGDLISCSYFDAAKHLLRYSRWLSLDYLSAFLVDDSDTCSSLEKEGADTGWKLTTSNRKASREEMENIVLTHPIEQSEVGDRYTWMESECDKLLKSLRHQSDLRYMTYFIQPNWPGDYAAYVSKPIDWEQCQRNLQQRKYQSIGEAVEDLRLIFSNALKYNARAKGTDTVSGRAYDAAVYMSVKLEAAIHKMLLSVCDRMERDKIDQTASDRQDEAAEQAEEDHLRAEEERLRSAWQKEREKSRKTKIEVEKRVEVVETVKVIQRKLPQRKKMMDFDFPFYDEVDDHEETHMEALRQQKLLFEKQKIERAKLRKMAVYLGISVFARMEERARDHAKMKARLSEQLMTESHGNIGISEMKKISPPESTDSKNTAENGCATRDALPFNGSKIGVRSQKVKIAFNGKSRPKNKRLRQRITLM